MYKIELLQSYISFNHCGSNGVVHFTLGWIRMKFCGNRFSLSLDDKKYLWWFRRCEVPDKLVKTLRLILLYNTIHILAWLHCFVIVIPVCYTLMFGTHPACRLLILLLSA